MFGFEGVGILEPTRLFTIDSQALFQVFWIILNFGILLLILVCLFILGRKIFNKRAEASKDKTRIEQKRYYYQLRILELDNPNIEINGLSRLIKAVEAEMDNEDIIHVEKMIAKPDK